MQPYAPSFSFSVFAQPGEKKWCRCRRKAMISPTPPNLTARRSSATVHKSRAAYSWNYPESSTCNKQTDRFRPGYITPSVQVTLVPALLSFPPHLNRASHLELFRSPQDPSVAHQGWKQERVRRHAPICHVSEEAEAGRKGGEIGSRISPFGSSSGWS